MFGLHAAPLLATLLVGALSLVTAGGVGYRMGQDSVQADWDTAKAETADALALLAQRASDAERRYQVEAAKKRAIETRRVVEVRREIVRIPERGCPVQRDAHRLFLDAVCAFDRNAERPECLSAAVPGDANPAGTGRPGGEPAAVGS